MTRNRKQKRKVRQEMDSAGTCYLQAARNLSAAEQAANARMGLSTLLPKLTEMISGWRPGSLNTVASAAGGGKTTFALASAVEVLKSGDSVLLVSAELSESEIDARMTASLSGESMGAVSSHLGKTVHPRAVELAEHRLQSWEGRSFARISADRLSVIEEAARVRAKTPAGLGMLIVDGFELIREDSHSSFIDRVRESSRRLKKLALELNIPVLVATQSSLVSKPSTQDLGELLDMALVLDSDTVLMLEPGVDPRDGESVGELHVAKNRFGLSSTRIPYSVDYSVQRFYPRIETLDPELRGNPVLREWADDLLGGKVSLDELLQGWTTDGMVEEGFSLATILEVRIAMLSLESLVNDLRATGLLVSRNDTAVQETLERWKSESLLDESGPRATPEASVLAYYRRQLDLEEVTIELAALGDEVYYSKKGAYGPSKTGYPFGFQVEKLVALGAVTRKFSESVRAMRAKLTDCTVWELGEHGGSWFVEGTEDRSLAEAAFRGWLLQTDMEQAKEREVNSEGPTYELSFSASSSWFWSPLFPEIEDSEAELCNLHDQRDRWNGEAILSGTLITG